MAALPSVSELPGPGYLDEYCNPSSPFAWPAYDLDLHPTALAPTDVLAPALLSYPIKGTYLNEVFRRTDDGVPVNEYGRLHAAMTSVVNEANSVRLRFESIERDALDARTDTGWGLVLAAIDAAQLCKGLSSVAVTKILHRKRPDLVPINDSRVRSFYGATNDGYAPLFERIHDDIAQHGELLDAWRARHVHPDGRQMSRLRALDIVVWMHQRSNGAPTDDQADPD